MTSKPRFVRVLALSAVAAMLCVFDPADVQLIGPRDAHAVVGRPLTPVSYAGVARRTTRRSAYRGAAYGAAYAAPVAAAATVATLPAGCSRADAGGVYYACGGQRYEPYYDGPNVVYRVVP